MRTYKKYFVINFFLCCFIFGWNLALKNLGFWAMFVSLCYYFQSSKCIYASHRQYLQNPMTQIDECVSIFMKLFPLHSIVAFASNNYKIYVYSFISRNRFGTMAFNHTKLSRAIREKWKKTANEKQKHREKKIKLNIIIVCGLQNSGNNNIKLEWILDFESSWLYTCHRRKWC